MSFILARISSSVIPRKFFIFVISLVVTLAVFLPSKSSWASWPEYPNETIASLILFNPQIQEDYGTVRGIALAPDDTHAYLACDNDFVVVNLSGPSVETVLDWALGVDVAITPNGQYVYLAQENGYAKVLPTSNYSNSYFLLVSYYSLQNIDITPDGHYAYITSYDMNNHTGYLHVLDIWNNDQQVKNLTFQGRWLKDIDFSPDGRYAYVVDYLNHQLLAISTSDYTLVRTYNDTGIGPEQIAVTPDGKHAYLTHLVDDCVSDINLETGTISTIPVAGPRGVAITPDGKFVYITGSGPVQVIHTQDNSVDSINADCAGKAIAINSNGTRVYGASGDAWHSYFIVIGYGKGYKLIPIPSDSPPVSNVMAGGNVIRYYRVTDYDNTPKSGIPAKVEGNNLSWTFTSANDGLLTISIPVDSLGNPGDDVVCTITELNNEPVDPPTFGVHIVPREVASHYRFGSGASIGAAIGLGAKVGSKHGLNYTRKETDLTVDTDDIIDVEDFGEISGGIYAGCGVGGGIKGTAYAKADAKAGVDILASIANQYEFTSPYTDREKMCRSGLVLAKVFLGAAPPLVSDMVTWLADNYNSYFAEYKSGQTVSMGARVYGEASAGAGLGVAGDDEVYLGIGIGAGISGDAQVMVELISSYQYYGGSLDLTEMGAGVGFNCGVDVSAGITATAVGNAVRAGIGGDVSYQQELVLYANPGGELQRMEITFSSQKNWGIGIDGTIAPGSGTTDTVILTINKDQITSLASDIVDIALLSSYFNGISPGDIVLGPTRLRDEFRDLFNKLSTMNIPYRIEREKGCGFEFSPSISLALGVEIEAGVSFNVEKAVTYTREEGYIVGTDFDSKIPTAVYNDDSHVPSLNNLEYSDVIKDVAQTVYDAFSSAGKIVQGAAESVGGTMVYGYHWAKEKLTWKKLGETEEQKLTYSLRYYLEQQQNYQGTDEVFLFSSSVQDISDLSAKISSPVTITNGHANLTINPGQNEAQLTITYTDQQVSGLQEEQLCIHIWNQDTHKWQALASVVNTDLNQVTAPVSRLGTFSLFITFPTGDIELGINPELINLQNPQNITVTSEPISDSTGEVVPDGTLITVQSLCRYSTTEESFGQVLSTDEAPSIPGVQIGTIGGRISCIIAPPDEQGEGVIRARSVSGNAEGSIFFRTDAPPSVSLTNPLSGDVIRDTIKITASASDDTSVSRVDFMCNGVLLASDATSPYELSWDTTSVSEGPCLLSTVAHDLYGLTATDEVKIIIDRTNPLVQINNPPSDTFVAQIVQITGTVSDANLREYRVDYGAGSSPTSWSPITTSSVAVSAGVLATWNSKAVSDGTYTIRVQAEDKASNTAQKSILVKVDNTPPAVGWMVPNEGSVQSGTTTLMVRATDTNGVTKVEFYCDQTFIASCTSTSQNYTSQFNTKSVSDGVHTLTAVAYDLIANAASSSTWIAIHNGPCTTVNWKYISSMYSGLSVGNISVPAFGDLDGDGDLDMVVGDQYGTLRYFENTGSPNMAVWTEDSNMFNGVVVGGGFCAPALGDLDGDGDLDLVVGSAAGIQYFQNTGTPISAEWTEDPSMFANLPGMNYPAPALGDLDNDGDLDLVIGSQAGGLTYYRNTGTATNPEWTIDWSMINISTSNWSRPALGDLDNDGDLDLVIGGDSRWTGRLYYYENVGSATKSAWVQCNSMFNNIYVGSYEAPGLADLDGDGDVDLTLGEGDAVLNYYQNLLLSNDNTPPATQKIIGNPNYNSGEWVTTSTQITLQATDSGPVSSGVAYIHYEIWRDSNNDGAIDTKVHEENVSGDTTTFCFTEECLHAISWYAVDNLGNKEISHTQQHKVDDSPPVTYKQYGVPFYTDGGKDFIASSTTIALIPRDEPSCSSGVAETFYRINNGNWIGYKGPFNIQEEREHTIEFYSVDNLGNTESVTSQTVEVDNTPPVISNVTVEPSLVKPNVATTFTVTASISDAKSGVSLSTTLAHIQNPDENDLASFLLYDDGTHGDEISGDGIFTGQWTGSVPGISYIDITASDNLGNQSEAENAASILSDNTPPEAQITSPLSGALISGVIPIEGTAKDDNFKRYILSFGEGTDPLTWTTIITSTSPVSTGSLATWDTSSISGGTFSLKLTAEDKVQNKSEDRVVATVDNSYPRTLLIASPPSVVTRREPITFSWQGIDNITDPSNLKYQYKLEGYDADWSDWSSDSEVTYPELPQGKYTFYVRAKDEAGLYPPKDNSATASFSFTTRYALIVYPNPWYKTKHQGLPIIFSGVLPGSKVKIYTLNVEKIKELDVREGVNEVNWDLRNEEGGFVARGIYLYIVIFPDGTKKTGKIAIIK